MLYARLTISSLLLAGLLHVATAYAFEKQTIGRLEFVKINHSDFRFKAKIDTGATLSSLNAEILNEFNRGSEKWIRFRLESFNGQNIILERKIQRYVNIKRKLISPLRVPIINIGICIGNVYREAEVNLSNRTGFLYSVLIGRNYLQGYFIVDPKLKFTARLSCGK